jgi:hypothetical protein
LKAELTKSIGNINVPGSALIVMSRSEFQMCIRTSRDWKKMPCTTLIKNPLIIVFGVVALVFGEFTPLIVYLFGPSFLPGTCITSAQLDKRRRKRMDDLDRKRLPITPRVTPTIQQVAEFPRRILIHECRYVLL